MTMNDSRVSKSQRLNLMNDEVLMGLRMVPTTSKQAGLRCTGVIMLRHRLRGAGSTLCCLHSICGNQVSRLGMTNTQEQMPSAGNRETESD